MRILFLHQNFPGQFLHVARTLKAQGYDVRAITDARNDRPDLVPTLRYELPPLKGAVSPFARSFSDRSHRGAVVGHAMLKLRQEGFEPDLVVGHFGWGETLFVKDVWPRTRLVAHAEFYYTAEGADCSFDPEFEKATSEQDRLNRRMALRARYAAILLAMESADFGVAPTRWQGSRFPAFLQKRIAILHEGIDTRLVAPNPNASIRIGRNGASQVFKPGDEVITFVNRNLEPYRGYHISCGPCRRSSRPARTPMPSSLGETRSPTVPRRRAEAGSRSSSTR